MRLRKTTNVPANFDNGYERTGRFNSSQLKDELWKQVITRQFTHLFAQYAITN